jgi:hypothetical protein
MGAIGLQVDQISESLDGFDFFFWVLAQHLTEKNNAFFLV